MPFTEQDKQDMDNAAVEAENELGEIYPDHEAGVEIIADWLGKWFMNAGYKRLCRILLEYQSVKKDKNGA